MKEKLTSSVAAILFVFAILMAFSAYRNMEANRRDRNEHQAYKENVALYLELEEFLDQVHKEYYLLFDGQYENLEEYLNKYYSEEVRNYKTLKELIK